MGGGAYRGRDGEHIARGRDGEHIGDGWGACRGRVGSI